MVTEPYEVHRDQQRTVFTQKRGAAWKGGAILAIAAALTLGLAVFSAVDGEHPIVSVGFLVFAAGAVYLAWPRGQLRVEIRPDAIAYNLGQRETFRIEREGVDLVRVIGLRGPGKLGIRRQGHRLETYPVARPPGAVGGGRRSASSRLAGGGGVTRTLRPGLGRRRRSHRARSRPLRCSRDAQGGGLRRASPSPQTVKVHVPTNRRGAAQSTIRVSTPDSASRASRPGATSGVAATTEPGAGGPPANPAVTAPASSAMSTPAAMSQCWSPAS